MTRIIAVSGAASGIGKSLAELLRSGGDRVIGVDLKDTDVSADLSTPEGRDAAVRGVLELSGGRLDGVVACAGISAPVALTIKVNFYGVVGLLEGLRPALAEAPAPRAAVVGSISGTQQSDPAVVAACLDGTETEAVRLAEEAVGRHHGGLLYPSSKTALARWLRRASVTPEWAGAGIPLNAIAPGVVLTPMTAPLFEDEAMVKIMEEAVPMPLNGHAGPEVVAEGLRWLISPGNSHVTGQVVYLDGGAEATLRGPDLY
ncbi:SDR family oxidoreductase [Actinomadura sp. 9N407]|uniref:SDR family oxidoreductase n=1 Tax=Actinomadura sp. 9N407 TaxID=3375154 RepID=UPI00379E46C3